MVLESQMARAGGGRQYMTSRRRGRFSLKLPLTVLVVVGVIALSVYMIRNSGGASPANVGQAPATASTGGQNAGMHGGLPTPPPPAPLVDPAVTPRHDPPRQTDPTPTPPPGPRQTEPTPPTPTPPVNATTNQTATSAAVARKIAEGRDLIQRNELVAGRAALNSALAGPISDRDAAAVRTEMAAVNEKLVFSPLVDANDPYVAVHVLKSGEYLSTIAPKYNIPWQFIQAVNRIPDVRRIRVNQRLKVVKGPFHVVVDKSDFRADVYLGEGADRLYVRSFRVGTGEYDSTPVGKFVVRKHSKLVNPEWTNPRTGQRYLSDDKTNPVGEHWIGLRGVDENTEQMRGYGLHGTIEPQSIGTEASMGCVRFMPDDIELLFSMLVEEKSTVTIQP